MRPSPSEPLTGKSASQRVLDSWYQRIARSMDRGRALELLGFPADARPTEQEITKAYRAKVFENHPDRGGDVTRMVEINVAKDYLGSAGSGPWRPEPAPARSPAPSPHRPEPDAVMEGQSFEQAFSGAGIPAGVVWKFVSAPEWYWERSYMPGHRVWVMYGQTDTKHVFLAVKERGESAGTVPTNLGLQTKIMEDWQTSLVDVAITQPLAKIAPKVLKSVATSWADGAKMPPPKKYIEWPGGHPTHSMFKKLGRISGGAALKDILIGLGLAGSAGGKSTEARKTVVELFCKADKARMDRMKQKRRSGTVADLYEWSLRINGKAVVLDDDTIINFERRVIPWGIGWDFSGDHTYNITRMRGGRMKYGPAEILKEMVSALTGEPSWVHIALEAAAEEWETPEAKTARLATKILARYEG